MKKIIKGQKLLYSTLSLSVNILHILSIFYYLLIDKYTNLSVLKCKNREHDSYRKMAFSNVTKNENITKYSKIYCILYSLFKLFFCYIL